MFNLLLDVCTLPADVGRCRASFERYYFDSETNQCMKFIYGGCDGNGNNFQSFEECQKRCSSHIIFTLPPGSSKQLLICIIRSLTHRVGRRQIGNMLEQYAD